MEFSMKPREKPPTEARCGTLHEGPREKTSHGGPSEDAHITSPDSSSDAATGHSSSAILGYIANAHVSTRRPSPAKRPQDEPGVPPLTGSVTLPWHQRRHCQYRKQSQPLRQPQRLQHRADPGLLGCSYKPATPAAKSTRLRVAGPDRVRLGMGTHRHSHTTVCAHSGPAEVLTVLRTDTSPPTSVSSNSAD